MGAPAQRIAGLRSTVKDSDSALRLLGRASARLAARRMGGAGNHLQVGERSLLRGLRLDVRGRDNVVVIGADVRLRGVTVTIRGDGGRIVIGDGVRIEGPADLWLEDSGSVLEIGDRTTQEPGSVLAALEGQALTLGADCMLAGDVEIRTGDSHPIFALDAPGQPINAARSVTLGDHVWVGKRSFVLKGVQIADGVIVGAAAVVAQSVDTPACAVAGNPARVLREGVGWRR